MWPRKNGWLNFAILECSLNVCIVNKIVFAAPELCESALPNPKFLLHCRKWRNINLSWRKFQTSISSTLRNFFLVKTYKRDQWNLPNILAYISGIFAGFFKAGLVPLKLCKGRVRFQFSSLYTRSLSVMPAPGITNILIYTDVTIQCLHFCSLLPMLVG